MNEQLGRKLDIQYKTKGWSVEAAANFCGFNFQTFRDLCVGTHEFTRAIRAKLAEVFNDPTWLTA